MADVMADGQAGYTGVVYSEYEAGYTSAEGYTGVVRGTIASGSTGAAPVPSAPVTTKGGSAAGPILVTTGGWSEVDPIPVTPSPYDGVAADRGTAPGAALPLDYRPAPPPIDEYISREEEEAEPPPPPPQDPAAGQLAPVESPYSEGDDARVGKIDELVRSLLSVGRQIQLSPVPEPNESLALAQLLLENLQESWLSMRAGTDIERHLVVGRLADSLLNQQVAETLAQTKPNNLGVAYLQGISQEVLSTMIQATRSTTELYIDPVGTALDSAKGLVEAIRGRMDKEGERFWEAVNSVLNPVTRLVRAGEGANEIAGEALAAARRGEWDNAVRLAREAGRSATQAAISATEIYGMGRGVAGAYSKARGTLQRLPTRRRGIPEIPPEPPLPSRPPQPQLPPRAVTPDGVPWRSEVDPIPVAPPSSPRPDGLTGTVIHDGAAGPQLPPPASAPAVVPRPHPAQPKLPVFDRQAVEPERQMREQLLKVQQAEAAEQIRALRPEQRLNPKYRNTRKAVKAAYNSKEYLTASDLQRVYRDRGYLTDVKLVSVVRQDGVEIPTRDLLMAIDPDYPGRVFDVLEVRPDGAYGDYELKTTNSIEKAYPAKGVEVKAFKKSSILGKEIRKTNAVFDYAAANNGKVRVRGKDLAGRPVELELDPALFRGTTPATYRELPN